MPRTSGRCGGGLSGALGFLFDRKPFGESVAVWRRLPQMLAGAIHVGNLLFSDRYPCQYTLMAGKGDGGKLALGAPEGLEFVLAVVCCESLKETKWRYNPPF